MKTHKVVAKTGKGDDRKTVGEKDIKLADTLAEAVKIHAEAGVVKLTNQAHVTNTRNSLARPAGVSKLQNAHEIYQRAVEAKVPHAQALTIAGLTEEQLKELKAA